jgi:hypothetical protein
MKKIFIVLLVASCNQPNNLKELEQDKQRLQMEVDSLKQELYKCDMLIDSYEGMPMGI